MRNPLNYITTTARFFGDMIECARERRHTPPALVGAPARPSSAAIPDDLRITRVRGMISYVAANGEPVVSARVDWPAGGSGEFHVGSVAEELADYEEASTTFGALLDAARPVLGEQRALALGDAFDEVLVCIDGLNAARLLRVVDDMLGTWDATVVRPSTPRAP